jgi:hypothetical protein
MKEIAAHQLEETEWEASQFWGMKAFVILFYNKKF